MKTKSAITVTAVMITVAAVISLIFIPKNRNGIPENPDNGDKDNEIIEIFLSEPEKTGSVSLEETISGRRSIREYSLEEITEMQLSQLLWAIQGITDKSTGFRAAPSAGASYPLEIYAAIGNAEGFDPGLYKYSPVNHSVLLVKTGDIRYEIFEAGLRQECIRNAPVVFIFTAVFERTSSIYGIRADRYVYIETGHAAQNLYLQSEALGLGTVAIGAFDDMKIKAALNLPPQEAPVYIMPVGRKIS